MLYILGGMTDREDSKRAGRLSVYLGNLTIR
jgi:hypothetical protein